MQDRDASPTVDTGIAKIFDLHRVKDFSGAKRVRKKLFKTKQLWSEIACYEPGQSTVMHRHPYEDEAIYVLEGTAHMNVDGEELEVPAGSIILFPPRVDHDVRNLGDERCVIMFLKVPPGLAKKVEVSGGER